MSYYSELIKIENLLGTALSCVLGAKQCPKIQDEHREDAKRELQSAAWRIADAALLLHRLCVAENISGIGIDTPTGMGAMLCPHEDAINTLRQMQAVTTILGKGVGNICTPDSFFHEWNTAEVNTSRIINGMFK